MYLRAGQSNNVLWSVHKDGKTLTNNLTLHIYQWLVTTASNCYSIRSRNDHNYKYGGGGVRHSWSPTNALIRRSYSHKSPKLKSRSHNNSDHIFNDQDL
ncbi:hypothetical protein Bca4012_009009 [Brassica carinata]